MGGARTSRRISIRAYKNEAAVVTFARCRRSPLCRSVFAVSSCVISVVAFSRAPNLCLVGPPVSRATFATEYLSEIGTHGVLALGTDKQRHSKCEERILDLATMVHTFPIDGDGSPCVLKVSCNKRYIPSYHTHKNGEKLMLRQIKAGPITTSRAYVCVALIFYLCLQLKSRGRLLFGKQITT